MKTYKTIAATAADFQATLTNELGETIKNSVFYYINGRDPIGMVSSFEREMIAENAWFHVIEKREKYRPSKDAKFRTWAKRVAQNFASDELEKLQNDPLHMTGLLHEDQPKNEDDAKKYSDTVSYRRSFGSVGDCSDQLYWHEMLETLKGIVSTYVEREGRDDGSDADDRWQCRYLQVPCSQEDACRSAGGWLQPFSVGIRCSPVRRGLEPWRIFFVLTCKK